MTDNPRRVWQVYATDDGAPAVYRVFSDQAQADAFADDLNRRGYDAAVTPLIDLLAAYPGLLDYANRQRWLLDGAPTRRYRGLRLRRQNGPIRLRRRRLRP